jgi:hypothetical protein
MVETQLRLRSPAAHPELSSPARPGQPRCTDSAAVTFAPLDSSMIRRDEDFFAKNSSYNISTQQKYLC